SHYGLNLAMQQFCAHKQELLRVLDAPQLPLHTNAAEADIREYVTRHKISGGTRHDDGRLMSLVSLGVENWRADITLYLMVCFFCHQINALLPLNTFAKIRG
ncbi:IS66 family transposase, partial [Nostoc sp.]|uniref:IS66 family transposase n=1 Tax=Nostoc sp. TaxID=1180 RepID=UPI003FA5D0BC